METALTEPGKTQNIGDLLLQSDRWALIEDMVKGGYDSIQIARVFLQSPEFDDIQGHYKGNKQAEASLARLIRYHVQDKLPIANRVGVIKLRQYVDREIGLDVLKELKSAIVVQKERVGRAVAWENKLDIPNGASGKEVERLIKGLGVLGQLLIAAGMNLHEDSQPDVIDAEVVEGGGYTKLVMDELKKQGVPDRKASEVATGIPSLTDGKPA